MQQHAHSYMGSFGTLAMESFDLRQVDKAPLHSYGQVTKSQVIFHSLSDWRRLKCVFICCFAFTCLNYQTESFCRKFSLCWFLQCTLSPQIKLVLIVSKLVYLIRCWSLDHGLSHLVDTINNCNSGLWFCFLGHVKIGLWYRIVACRKVW